MDVPIRAREPSSSSSRVWAALGALQRFPGSTRSYRPMVRTPEGIVLSLGERGLIGAAPPASWWLRQRSSAMNRPAFGQSFLPSSNLGAAPPSSRTYFRSALPCLLRTSMGGKEDAVARWIQDDQLGGSVERLPLWNDQRPALESGANLREVGHFDVEHGAVRSVRNGSNVRGQRRPALKHHLHRATFQNHEAEPLPLRNLDRPLEAEPLGPERQARFDRLDDEVRSQLVHAPKSASPNKDCIGKMEPAPACTTRGVAPASSLKSRARCAWSK